LASDSPASAAQPNDGARSLGWGSSLLFAGGDFACNLYWQSITFYLLFFYTETLGLSAATAGLVTMIAFIWDGLAGLGIGLAADRGGARAFVRWGAVPLAVAFFLLYIPVPLTGAALAGFALIIHMLFRTLYVAVNVPYAALTVAVAPDSASRSRIAGLRMILGGGAVLVVAVATQVGVLLAGQFGYALAALPFGAMATLLLFLVARMRAAGDGANAPAQTLFRFRVALRLISGNRAFLLLNVGICGGVAALAVLTRAVPYYCKYVIGDAALVSAVLSAMSIAGVLVIPLWMWMASRFGPRVQWQVGALVTTTAGLGLLWLRPIAALPTEMLFALFYAGAQAFFFGFWALIPDVVEHGGPADTPRMDVLLFAVAALLQKVMQGVAVAAFGYSLSAVGYAPRYAQPADVQNGLALLTSVLPLAGVALASLAMMAFRAPSPRR